MAAEKHDAVIVKSPETLRGRFGVVREVDAGGNLLVYLPRQPGEGRAVVQLFRPGQLRLLHPRRRRRRR